MRQRPQTAQLLEVTSSQGKVTIRWRCNLCGGTHASTAKISEIPSGLRFACDLTPECVERHACLDYRGIADCQFQADDPEECELPFTD